MAKQVTSVRGAAIAAAVDARSNEILSSEAIGLLVELERRFGSRRKARCCVERDARTNSTRVCYQRPCPRPKTFVKASGRSLHRHRDSSNARSRSRARQSGNDYRRAQFGASIWLADFEETNVPTWENMVRGRCNLLDAVRRTISFASPGGKRYTVAGASPTIVVRPRGWHFEERHILVDGQPGSARLVDFALYFANAGREVSPSLKPHCPYRTARCGRPSS